MAIVIEFGKFLLAMFAFGAGVFTAAFVLMWLTSRWETRHVGRGGHYDHERLGKPRG